MKRKELARLTEQNIFDSAMALIKEHGLQQVQIKDICGAAGVSVGTFYHYFPSKQSICVRLVEHHNELLMEQTQHFMETKPSVLDVFLFISRFIEGFGPDLVRQLFVYDLGMGENSSIFIRFTGVFNLIKALLEETFQKQGMERKTAGEGYTLFVILYKGLLYDWCIKKYSLEEATEATLGTYLKFMLRKTDF